jgi:hypothetical protein
MIPAVASCSCAWPPTGSCSRGCSSSCPGAQNPTPPAARLSQRSARHPLRAHRRAGAAPAELHRVAAALLRARQLLGRLARGAQARCTRCRPPPAPALPPAAHVPPVGATRGAAAEDGCGLPGLRARLQPSTPPAGAGGHPRHHHRVRRPGAEGGRTGPAAAAVWQPWQLHARGDCPAGARRCAASRRPAACPWRQLVASCGCRGGSGCAWPVSQPAFRPSPSRPV